MVRPSVFHRRYSAKVFGLHRRVIGAICWFVAIGSLQADPSAVVKSEFIYDGSDYPTCHASTIAQIPTGQLVAAWFGGSAESRPDVCIYLSRYDGRSWSRGTKVADGVQDGSRRYACWNPVLFQAREGPLLLFYRVGPSPEKWWSMLMRSEDGGHTWTKPQRLPDGILGPIKNKPLELPDGTLLCGSSKEAGRGRVWRVYMERTPDLGRTWTSVGPLNAGGRFNAIQPTILRHPDGRLQILCRTEEMTLATSWSSDGGVTWSRLAPSGLYAVNSGIDAVTLVDGRQLLVYNLRERPDTGPPAVTPMTAKGRALTAKERPKARWPLVVALSTDGVHWRTVLTLESKPIKDGYAYPAIIQTHDGLVHITYTWNRQKIKHVVLNPAKI